MPFSESIGQLGSPPPRRPAWRRLSLRNFPTWLPRTTQKRRRSNGNTRPQRYLGPAKDPTAQQAAAAVRRAAAQARDRRKVVIALKAADVPAPDIYTGKILEVMANAGLFGSDAILVGTVAYHTIRVWSAFTGRPARSRRATLI
jgi:hypothetical protein